MINFRNVGKVITKLVASFNDSFYKSTLPQWDRNRWGIAQDIFAQSFKVGVNKN